MEHPSLKTRENKPLTADSLRNAASELNSLRETMQGLKFRVGELEGELESLSAVQLLASMEQKLSVFMETYGEALGRLAAAAEAETEFLRKATALMEHFLDKP